jgi:hypothetical protein
LPHNFHHIALALSLLSKGRGPFSVSELSESFPGKKSSMNSVLRSLVACGAVLEIPNNGKPAYQIDPSKNFVTVSNKKRVNVSTEGNRYVRVVHQFISMKNGLNDMLTGSTYWKDENKTPKLRLGNVKRKNLADPDRSGRAWLALDRRNHNNVAYKLQFDPALAAGEYIRLSFSIWMKSYYGRTINEVQELYGDTWIREGLAVPQPAINVSIKVKLPRDYAFQEAIAEKNPVLSLGGPNIPGERLCTLAPDGGAVLNFNRDNPSIGAYFVSWIPPLNSPSA